MISTTERRLSCTGDSADAASATELLRLSPGMPDLAPTIFRRRLVIEGTCPAPIAEDQMSLYLRTLSHVCGMRQLAEPVTHRSERYGWAGWIHWENSGAHFYAWDSPVPFFSVDIYTCKEFDVERVCGFTRSFFGALQIAAMAF